MHEHEPSDPRGPACTENEARMRLTCVGRRDADVHDRELLREAEDGRAEERQQGHPERREERGQHCPSPPSLISH